MITFISSDTIFLYKWIEEKGSGKLKNVSKDAEEDGN